MKKRGFSLLFVLALICLLLGQAAFAPASQAADISVIINGNQLKADVAPYIQDERVLVPFRALFEALGATVGWDAVNQVVTGARSGKEIKLTIDSKTAYVDGKPVELAVPATITGERTFVPLRFVGESLGADVSWEDASQTVKVSLGAATNAATSSTTSSAAGSTQPGSTSSKKISITDSYGNNVVVPSPPKRIVASNASVAQMICALGAGDSIVGVADTTTFPPVLRSKDKVGASMTNTYSVEKVRPIAEKIISLKPDIFFGYGNYTHQDLIDKLKRAGIPVVMLDCYKLDTMKQDVATLGRIMGREQVAADFNSFYDKYLNLIESRTSSLPASKKPLVYFEGYTDYSTYGPGSTGLQMLEAAGGRNVAGDYQIPFPKVSAEWVLAKNPQFVFKVPSSTKVPSGYGESANPMAAARQDLMGRPGWGKIDAVKSGKVYIISGQIYSAHAIVGTAYFAKWLHPDLFKDLDLAVLNRELLTKFYGLEPEGAWTCP